MIPRQNKDSKTGAFRTIYGTVRVYTRRHLAPCPLNGVDQNHCSCPKWIYSKARGGRARQAAAGTPSFAEAVERAQHTLKGFDPEIAAARAEGVRKQKDKQAHDIVATFEDFYRVLAHERHCSPRYVDQARTLLGWRDPATAMARGKLLRWIDAHNAGRAREERILTLEQLNKQTLREWRQSWGWKDSTSAQRSACVRSFFAWCVENDYLLSSPATGLRSGKIRKGNRCGYFREDQFQNILNAIPFFERRGKAKQDSLAARMRAFVELGRWGGLAIADIMRFNPRESLGENNVLSYRRAKNGEVAVVLIPPDVADRLRNIPLEPNCVSPEQPLRLRSSVEANALLWRTRFRDLCKRAGIQEVETEIGTIRNVHPHMLRDTCAIDAIVRGVSLENVAKMLGHSTVQMTQKHYLFWIEKRVASCIEDQRAALTRVKLPSASVSGRRPSAAFLQ